jgi:hypothetical protein
MDLETDEAEPAPGAWPVSGVGPREGLRPGLFWPVRRDRAGVDGPTPWQARGADWRTTSRGLYAPVTVDPHLVEQRIVEAAAVVPGGAVVTGWAALRWWGGAWFDGLGGDGRTPLPVPLAVGADHARRPQPDVFEMVWEFVAPRFVARRDGIRLTSPAWSVTLAMRRAKDLAAAVRIFDMAAYSDLVSIDEVVAFTRDHLGTRTGVERVREAMAYAEENAWSPTEVDFRLVWQIRGQCPRPLCNVPVFDLAGRLVGAPDLLDPVAGVAGDYDGALHLEGAQRSRDVVREEAFRSVGLEPVTMLAGDRHDPTDVVGRLHAAYDRAARKPASDRRWTIEAPSWWIPTDTVARRRALSQQQRARLLRLRRRAA